MVKKQKYIFYVGQSDNINSVNRNLDKNYTFEIWRPTMCRLIPRGLFKGVLFIWWMMYSLGLFSNSNYSIFLVYHNEKVIHYSVVLPKFFKTSFMKNDDLQIGPIWTQENQRGKGVASYAIQKILEVYKKQNRRFWYIVREENSISRQFIERFGFTAHGKGIKKKRFGLGVIGSFTIENKY